MSTLSNVSGRIIVVDDDKMISDLLRRILKRHYDVACHSSAEELMHSADLLNADAVIADIKLPGMNGLQLLQELHQTDLDIPVIMITGYAEIEDAITALKHGAFDFILKPFQNEQILVSVEKALSSRALIIENKNLVRQLKIKNHELENLNSNMRKRTMEIEKELDMASNLQKCLFPVTFPSIDGFDFSLKYLPVEKISGDFYDFVDVDRNRFDFIFADVSGHGVPAALYSAIMKTALISVYKRIFTPSEVIEGINRFLINAQKTMSYNYATVFWGTFDSENGLLHYGNAGIPAPVIIRDNGKVVFLGPNGPFVGIFESAVYRHDTVPLMPGDKLVFYTDGVFECTDKDDKILGQKIFLDMLNKYKKDNIHDMMNNLYSDIMKKSNEYRVGDDITLLAMHYIGKPE